MRVGGKSYRLVGLVAGLSLLAGGCGDVGEGQVGGDEQAETSRGLTFEQFKAQTYREPDSGIYIVNGDTAIDDEKELYGFYKTYVEQGQLIVHTVNGVDAKWSATQKLNLSYCVSTTFGTNHTAAVNAMAAAASAWEAAANVKFVYVSAQNGSCTASNNNVLFDVNPVNSGGQYLARAFFPDSPRSSRNVLIDNTAFGNTSPWTLAGILRHELGHTLGFRHEHTRPEAGTCFEDNNWRALTSYDSFSVMHYPQCNGDQTGDLVLTTLDKQGVSGLYGAPGGGNPDPDPTTTTETFSGSLAQGQNANFGPFSVKAGTVFTASITGTGDADLYVRFGAAPTTTSYNCRPYQSGSSETCSLTVPTGTTQAYVMVRGYTASTFNLTVTYVKGSGTGGGTVTTQNFSGSVAQGQNINYPAFSVVAGTTFTAAMSGGTGDADLYVRFGAPPTTTTYSCRPYRTGNAETCTLTVPSGTTSAYVMVRGYTAATYNLAVTWTKP
jgi:serine protease